jgi:hypothetical protein
MQNYVAVPRRNGGFELSRSSPTLASPPSNSLPKTMPLDAFEEHIAWSYFFSTHGWAIFWRSLFRTALEVDSPAPNRTCSLAIVYGHMGRCLKKPSLVARSQWLYAATLRGVQSLLAEPSKTELVKLTTTCILMGMYNVSPA